MTFPEMNAIGYPKGPDPVSGIFIDDGPDICLPCGCRVEVLDRCGKSWDGGCNLADWITHLEDMGCLPEGAAFRILDEIG